MKTIVKIVLKSLAHNPMIIIVGLFVVIASFMLCKPVAIVHAPVTTVGGQNQARPSTIAYWRAAQEFDGSSMWNSFSALFQSQMDYARFMAGVDGAKNGGIRLEEIIFLGSHNKNDLNADFYVVVFSKPNNPNHSAWFVMNLNTEGKIDSID